MVQNRLAHVLNFSNILCISLLLDETLTHTNTSLIFFFLYTDPTAILIQNYLQKKNSKVLVNSHVRPVNLL